MQAALAHVGLHAALHFVVIWVALTIAFRLKLAQLTSHSVQGEIEEAMEKVLDGPTGALTSTLRKHVSACDTKLALQRAARVISVLGASDGGGESATAVHNRGVLRESVALGVVVPMAGTALLVALIAAHHDRCRRRGSHFELPVWEIVGSLAVSIAVIGAYEGLFVTRVATRYVPIKASAVVETATRRAMQWLDGDTDPPMSVADAAPQRAGLLAASCGAVAAAGLMLAHATSRGTKRAVDAVRGVPATVSLAVSSSLCIGIAVTAVYFTKAKEGEARQFERQVQRNVDAAMHRYDAISEALLCRRESRRLRDAARSALADMLERPPDTTDAQRAIDEHNRPLERASQRMVMAAAAGALIVTLAGGLWVRGVPGALPLYVRTAVLSSVVGAGVSFTAEYGFLQGVMARFEGSEPERTVNNVVKRLAAAVPTDDGECPAPYCA